MSTKFVPGPALAQLTRDVLERFATKHPHGFVWIKHPGVAYDQQLADWAFALRGIPAEAIEMALQEWISTSIEFPRAPTFSAKARGHQVPTAKVDINAHEAAHSRRRTVAQRMAKVLHGWREIAEFHDWMLARAATDKERTAVRDSMITLSDLDLALDAFLQQRRRTA